MGQRHSVHGLGAGTLSLSCDLRDVARADPPPLVDVSTASQTAIVNPTFFITRPSALTSNSVPELERNLPARLWVRDASTEALWPFLSDPLDPLIPERLAQNNVREMDRSDCEVLRKATVIVRPEELANRAKAGQQQASRASVEFTQHGWCRLENLLHPAQLIALGRCYRDNIRDGGWPLGDRQVAGRYSCHDEPATQFVHRQLATYVSRIVLLPVRPSYSFVSCYQGGAHLRRHTDRKSCEFTLSLAIEQTDGTPWPLKLETAGGVEAVACMPGEAVLFRGTMPHYRDRLPPDMALTTVLFHYVQTGANQ